MEEKKNKVVNMNTEHPEKPKKLTYEQLESVAHQLSDQAKRLYARLQEVEMGNAIERIGFLFKVVEFADRFEPSFVAMCTSEIEKSLIIKEDTKEKTNEQEG